MGDLFKNAQKYATKQIKKEIKKEAKSLKGKKSKKQPLGDKDDPVDGIVRIAASLVGTISEAHQYRKEKKAAAAAASAATVTEIDGTVESATSQDGGVTPRRRTTALPEHAEDNLAQGRSSDLSPGSDEGDRNGASPPRDFSEAAWQLDDARQGTAEATLANNNAAETAEANKPEEEKKKKSTDWAADFIQRHPFDPATAATRSQIDLPVVIPQRRPKNRGRGFVRAYSPVLSDAGIDQKEFLDFVDTFNRASTPSEWIQLIDTASTAGLVAPFPFDVLIDAACMMVVEAATEAQSRYRGGRFIDRVNAEYFVPRGLVALVVTWQSWDGERPVESTTPMSRGSEPQSPSSPGVSYDGADFHAQSSATPDTGFSQAWRDVRTQKKTPKEAQAHLTQHMTSRMKRYNGVFECPESAPLVFPSVEEDYEVMTTKKNGKKMNKFDRGEQWLNGFSDRRAQVKLANKTPDSTAAGARKHEFRSRYADPSHPAASGDIVAFATGGKWSTRGKVRSPEEQETGEISSDEERADAKWAQKKEKLVLKRKEKAKKRAEKEKKGGSALSNLLRTDVLYLVVMNIPTPAEQAAAAESRQNAQASEEESHDSMQEINEPSSVRQPVSNVADTSRNGGEIARHEPRIAGHEHFDVHPYEPAPAYEEAMRQQGAQYPPFAHQLDRAH